MLHRPEPLAAGAAGQFVTARALLPSGGMLYALVPLVVMVLGLVMWKPTAKEAGAVMFWVGLFISTWLAAHAVLKL